MIIDSYRSVFGNVYLATKIYNSIHQIQIDRYPLKYDDIIDVGWMLKYGHVGLAREKIKRNEYLYVKPKHLFSIVANTDTQMFISLFEKNKYYALGYYDTAFESMFQNLVNVDVVKYLFQNGYARDLSNLDHLRLLDIKVLSWLLENQWLKPTPLFLISSKRDGLTYIFTSTRDTDYTKEFVDLVAQYTPSPIQHAEIEVIMRYTLNYSKGEPCPFIFDSLSLLFVKDPDIRFQIERGKGPYLNYQQACQEIKQRREKREISEIKNSNTITSCSELLLAMKDPAFESDMAVVFKIWISLLSQGEQVFYDMWNALASRLIITRHNIYFYQSRDITDDDDEDDLIQNKNTIDISKLILDAICKIGSLKVVKFVTDQGHSPKISYSPSASRYLFFKQIMDKTLSLEECHIIDKLCNASGQDDKYKFQHIHSKVLQRNQMLSKCCRHGNAANFESLYLLFQKSKLFDHLVPGLYEICMESEQYHMIPVLERHGLFLLDHHELSDLCSEYPFTRLLNSVDRMIAATTEKEVLLRFYTRLLISAIKHNDLIAVKHIFTKHKFESLSDDLKREFSSLQNIAILDYINKNRWHCFTKETLINNYVHSCFIEIPCIIRSPSPINIPLVEYLIKEKCINFEEIKSKHYYLEPFFGDDINCILEEKICFEGFVYLIDHNNYFSIDPFMNLLTNNSFDYKYFEYIYRNQHKFQTKPSFQSIFDHIVINNLNLENIQKSKDKLEALVQRYGCVLNDSHYHDLVKHTDGLTLFGIVPDSIFVSNEYHPPPIQGSTTGRPLKKQKK
ncbi:hypothetical protein CYY_010120 [Polysphondylium violaceum]|uniref:Uncharacterized protein n=1 Tax=Polysphondylium violaceum TaxID=133409 RepID=A0A8J4PL45_9MYCE|nr:hypothetical protein CYY_010120 [Polysphondylium violaceum]